MKFDQVEVVYDAEGKRGLVPTGEEIFFEADEVLIAIGQDNAFPWIERDLGIEFGKWDMPQVNETSFQSSNPKSFRRRCRIWPREHHYGGRTWPSGRRVN